MLRTFLAPGQALLDQRFPLPLERPFSAAQATAVGIRSSDLSLLVDDGLLRRIVPGVYAGAQLPDTLDTRAAALRLVVPPSSVVTDRTAGWLHGAPMILAPGDHLATPPLSVFDRKRGGRLRNELTASGQRMMPDDDVMEVRGLLVTTPLRTACDLGRLLKRDQAFAALCMMLRLGAFSHNELIVAAGGFRGYRWVRQMRSLAPLADGRFQSVGEAIVFLRWTDCSDLPRPEPQRPVPAPAGVWGGYYFIDLGVDELRFGVEYDGKDFHGPAQKQHDDERRRWIRDEEHWTLRVVRKHNLHGPRQDVEQILRTGIREARAALGRRRTFPLS